LGFAAVKEYMWVVLDALDKGAFFEELLLLTLEDLGPLLCGQNVVQHCLVLLLMEIRQESQRVALLNLLALSKYALNHRHILALLLMHSFIIITTISEV